MNFKIWLEAEEIHPFEAWHKEYQAAKYAERNYPRRPPKWERPSGKNAPITPLKSKALLKDPRANQSIYVVEVLRLDGNTGGYHGYGDQEDVAADDPAKHARWEIRIDGKTEQKLVGKTAFIVNKSGGSYHEMWLRIWVYVIANDIVSSEFYHDDTPKEDQLEYNTFSSYEYKDIVKFFKFQSVRQAAEIVEEMEPNLSFPAEEDESRDDYWKRVMKGLPYTPPSDPSGHKDTDDYWRS